jgi:hypothetical protein
MGFLPGVLVCVVLPAVAAFTRAGWALRGVQMLLAAGSVSWVVTALRIGAQRRVAGEPWLRMALILGTVSVLSAVSAIWLFRCSRRK